MNTVNGHILGIDVGSVSTVVAEVSPGKGVVRTEYKFHGGDVKGCLTDILTKFDLSSIAGVAATSSTPEVFQSDARYDNNIAIISAARRIHRRIGSILVIGGERFGVLVFDRQGRYRKFRTNTSCAAGTGSFLDQQARRLNLGGVAELSETALCNNGQWPKIASRCAVFAKTDLVHAQQEGYSLEEICDGLCRGLAKNVVDTLFGREDPMAPIILTGGVARNKAVVRHLADLLGVNPSVDEDAAYGAVGAALCLLEEQPRRAVRKGVDLERIIRDEAPEKRRHYGPLMLELSPYPDFNDNGSYLFRRNGSGGAGEVLSDYPVEVDVYTKPRPDSRPGVYIGLDIGSTSTKAALLDENREMLAGFYTRTGGRPVRAMQNLLAALDDFFTAGKWRPSILGVGTTGSGRKLVGRIVGADLIIDEITAHARAAYELNPEVDTIIEIGGQDSKFTTLQNGRVSFSVMNHVCAAGTGSFIEELADRLGCPLSQFADRAMGRRSPMASDRCTVFMERDINHHLREGFCVDEVLASVLHSIRENYLTKVAVEPAIGRVIAFQGATAKNKALAAAFEQRLKRPILVSRYCHLTGALGAALSLLDQGVVTTDFRGLGLHRENIPLRSEVCDLCPNHCKITVADLAGRQVAYGFLCGRDYRDSRRVDNNRSGFDLLKTHNEMFDVPASREAEKGITIGLPAALYMAEDLPLWKKFFEELGVAIITGERYREGLHAGARQVGAELCAPMIALHGQVQHLLDKADFVFLPVYLERRSGRRNVRRQFCYYTQYASSLGCLSIPEGERHRVLRPLVQYLYTGFYARRQLFTWLKPVLGRRISYPAVAEAWSGAVKWFQERKQDWKKVITAQRPVNGDIDVVLLGRPYTVLSKWMNKGIPDIFQRLGIKTFYQDMLEYSREDVANIEPLLDETHWEYGAAILAAAERTARTKGLYPVLITSFKCTPDSFIMDYFKKVMQAHQKPYLILQLDEHDSNVGYETRIEAAVRSFRNHHQAGIQGSLVSKPVHPRYPSSLTPKYVKDLNGKTLFLPDWDHLTLSLIAANLRRIGVDARLLEPSEAGLQKGLRHNTGQCIPLNIVAQDFIDNVQRLDMDPSRAVLWNITSQISCNLGLFAHHIRGICHEHGQGMERAGVYRGTMSFGEFSLKLPLNMYLSYMFGGLMRRAGCRIRPYEKVKGATDRVIDRSLAKFEKAFLEDLPLEPIVSDVADDFLAIETNPGRRPKVAVFGDLYARDNDRMNMGLERLIEDNGGEVVTTPYHYYIRMIAGAYIRKWFFEGEYWNVLLSEAWLMTLTRLEKRYYKYFERVLGEPAPSYNVSPRTILSDFGVRIENTGESLDNLLKVYYLTREYPDLSLFVQTSPAFCCPSLVTEAMSAEIEKQTGVPVLTITYDGTGGDKNRAVVPYLWFAEDRNGESLDDSILKSA